jgi:transposase InsO family protein
LVALLDKFSEGTAHSFLDRVLNRFGAPVEGLTDQGREFLGEFQTLCEQAMIDHRTTSRDHPKADGLAERTVQTVKRGLRKYTLKKGHHGDWDLQLPWLTMGYWFSKQASLASFSPYYLLFGRHPVLPKAIQANADTVLANMDNPNTWALVSEQRADLFKRVMPMALENISIAQHRDTLWYTTIQGGGYRP